LLQHQSIGLVKRVQLSNAVGDLNPAPVQITRESTTAAPPANLARRRGQTIPSPTPETSDNEPPNTEGQLNATGTETRELQGGEELGLIGVVQIEYVEGSDVIVIKGHERDLQRVTELIDEIERLSEETEPEAKVVPLRHVDGRSVAQILKQLYGEVYAPRQGQVNITPLVKPNALLLVGRAEAVQMVLHLIGLLDRPVTAESQFQVFRLSHVSATEAERMVKAFFEDASSPAPDTDRGALGTKVRITADVRSNSLVVQARTRDLAEVDRLLKMIDVETSQVEGRVQVFQLRNARADEIGAVLQQAICGQSGGRAGGPLPG
jgi:general secretion pathway protein D